MEKSGFFNALRNSSTDEYDRVYNADDYSDNLAVVISNGVLRSSDNDLRVTANGMVVSVNSGRAWINGKYYKNTETVVLQTVRSTTSQRHDRVILRLDKSVGTRAINLVYVEGTDGSETKPELVREGDIFELCLAEIAVYSVDTSVNPVDTRSDKNLCGWVYSVVGDQSFIRSLDETFTEWFNRVQSQLQSVTLIKHYQDIITTETATSSVSFNIPQYDDNTCFLEVYVNGIFETRYTLSGTVITFTGTLVAGTVVTVNCYKSIDGTGIMDVAEEITILQNQVAQMQGRDKFTYNCTGLNDNVALSQIAKWILYGTTPTNTAAVAFKTALGSNWQSGLSNTAQVTVYVKGTLGATAAYSGNGESATPYKYFDIGNDGTNGKKLIFDFANCDEVSINCAANAYSEIFYGKNMFINNLRAKAVSAGNGCKITMIASPQGGEIKCENCNIYIESTFNAYGANNGTFVNCNVEVRSKGDHAICFLSRGDGFIRVIGGTCKAYSHNSYTPTVNAVFWNISNSGVPNNNVTVAEFVNCPTVAVSGYNQVNCYYSKYGSALLIGTITTLSGESTSGHITLLNTIAQNKPM